MHPAALPLDSLLRAVEFRTSRGPGPGGQHRNKSDTMVRVTHRPTGIGAQAGERRSLEMNRRNAIHRLRLNLALQIRCEPEGWSRVGDDPGSWRPSAHWQERVRRGRIAVSASHEDFPAILAEALDVLARHGDDVGRTARSLGVTSSQLVKLLAVEPAALAAINSRRRASGRAPLR
jgi:hypothetical protein